MDIAIIILYALWITQGVIFIILGIYAILKIRSFYMVTQYAKHPEGYRPVTTVGFAQKNSKEPPETEEQRRQRILDENVENYDGTGRNQVKI